MVSTSAITAMKAMAADPKKRHLLVKDSTCMGGLILVLSNPELSLVTVALETLLLVAEDLESRPEMNFHIGLQEQLEALLKRCECDSIVKTLAERLLLLLTGVETVTDPPLRDTSNIPSSRKAFCQKIVQTTNSRSTKSVVLQLRGVFDQNGLVDIFSPVHIRNISQQCYLQNLLQIVSTLSTFLNLFVSRWRLWLGYMQARDTLFNTTIYTLSTAEGFQADRDLCMRLLLKVKGVISVTFDMTRKRCLLRVKTDVKPESLVRAIAKSMTMTAQQIIKNENGDEVLLSFSISDHQGTGGMVVGKENEALLPPYLSDQEEKSDPGEDATALSRGPPSESTASKWFGAAASFLTNSFFW